MVLDFFAGSGTTGRVCIEENRHSILVDSDPKTLEYLNLHLEKMPNDLVSNKYTLHKNSITLDDFLKTVEQ